MQSETPEQRELSSKLAELAALEAELTQAELDLATLRAELRVFEERYLRIVGVRYAGLDDLRAQIAEIQAHGTDDPIAQRQAAEARRKAGESAKTASTFGQGSKSRFEPSESLKKLYREVAKRIHPDLATHEKERARRTQLMAEANHAYEVGDEARLQAILLEWETSPEAVAGEGPGAELVRTIRKIAQVRSRLGAIQGEMNELKESSLYALKTKVDKAEVDGRDLLAEMGAALDGQIAAARAQLSRITRKEASV